MSKHKGRVKVANRPKIKEIHKTTDFCPTQWEGYFVDGSALYIRYRWGALSIYKGRLTERSYPIYSEIIGDEYDGVLSESDLIRHTRNVVKYPKAWLEQYEDI